MYTQQNSLQAFVSSAAAPFVTPGAVSTIPSGSMAMVDKVTGLVVAGTTAADCYIVFNDGGNFKRSRLIIGGFLWASLPAYAAPVAQVQTCLIPAIVVGENYQVAIKVFAPNSNGDETKIANVIAKTGDTITTVAAALALRLNASLAKDAIKDYTVSATAGTITVTALKQPFKLGRKPGGYTRFNGMLTSPAAAAFAFTTTVAGSAGRGTGEYVQSQEFFARQNSDAVSINEFRTAYPVKLNALATGTYKVMSLQTGNPDWTLAANAQYTPSDLLIAFQQ